MLKRVYGTTTTVKKFMIATGIPRIVSMGLWMGVVGFSIGVAFGDSPSTTRTRASEPDFQQKLEFNRDIRPILSDRCFLCHGPDQSSETSKETDLRLDSHDAANEFGVFDFDEVDSSELVLRVLSEDPVDQMPPPDSNKKRLSEEEVETIRTWISQGAEYEQHWAYLPPKRPQVPALQVGEKNVPAGNAVDAFVRKRLEESALSPAPLADRATLIRRVAFDLTGLPPTTEQVDDFVSDPAALNEAYEKVVDRLLASDDYGENMARYWLDAARYSDSNGYQYDTQREQWVWRDWVINAFNQNLSFDQFTIQQIAGDLLPDATEQNVLATGFNRNHPITIEGGVVDEEYRTEYVMDRVSTVSMVFLGQTYACARCHDHKYDPISQKDFYKFYSFFNNVPEKGFKGFDPKRPISSPLAKTEIERCTLLLKAAQEKFDALELPLEKWRQRFLAEIPKRSSPKPESVLSTGGATIEILGDNSVLMTGTNPDRDTYEVVLSAQEHNVSSIQLEALTHESLVNKSASRGGYGNFVLTEFSVEVAPADRPNEFESVSFESAEADYEQANFPISKAIDGKGGQRGWAVDGRKKPENRRAIFGLAEPVVKGSRLRIKMDQSYGINHQIGRFRISFFDRPVSIKESGQEKDAQKDAFLIGRYGDDATKVVLKELSKRKAELKKATSFPATMVMSELETPRLTHVLDRGEYDKPRLDELVTPGLPEAFGSLDGYPANRLGLSQWLVSADQPLMARVTVNRFWQQLFGTGLVKTSEDFGSQGEFPTHPDLLDWLAVEFRESDWDTKRFFKLLVMSNTYRQSSQMTAESHASDPENRLLARGPNGRLDGETIRDAALAVSGLLDRRVGGPSVYPYHPEGLWWEISNRPGYSQRYPHKNDFASHFRRSMYSFWKRSVPPPSVATFDAPNREYCVVRRSRTNTPLQALVMLHDPQFIEAAQFLASRMITEASVMPESKIQHGFKLCMARNATEAELQVLLQAYQENLKRYQGDPDAIEKLLSIGIAEVNPELDPVELSALTQVARMLMNLSEFITKG